MSSAPPGTHAGNLDNKDLVAGTTLFIPVHAAGALFEVGDGHAGQGNGEVDITALETSLVGTFEFVVRKDLHLKAPRGETPTHFIAMGLNPDLTEALKMAVREAIDFLVTEKHLSREDAYMLCSVGVDFNVNLSQIAHNLQTAEAIRRDGHPRWFQLTGLMHDLGKVLCLWGEPQWAVVGDTFPVGCAWSAKIVFPEFFGANPDAAIPEYQTRLGVYEENCGLDKADLSWGHDEYLYHVVKDYLPEPALYMIRYHSFYPAHREGEYGYLMNAHDREMFEWVRKFNPYDLYSKSAAAPDVAELRPYYEELIAEFFPARIAW